MKYIKLFTDTNVIIIRLKNLLEAEGIPFLVKDHFEAALLGGFGGQQASVELYVLEKDLEQAEKVLLNYKSKINT
jgi:hypothetical protein